MGLLLSEIIVDVLRQAVPIVGAVTGAYLGMKRTQRTGKRPVVTVATFSGLGWLAGYVLNRGIMRVLEGRSPQLPSNTLPLPAKNLAPLSLPPASVPTSDAPIVTPPVAGMNEADMYNYTVPSTPVAPPRARNDGVEYGTKPKRNRAGRNLNLAAFGQLYGNE